MGNGEWGMGNGGQGGQGRQGRQGGQGRQGRQFLSITYYLLPITNAPFPQSFSGRKIVKTSPCCGR
jgi:hypothetical protein